MQPIVALAPKGRQQGRVHVHDAVGEGLHKAVAGNGEKAREHHQLHVPGLQGVDQRLAVDLHVRVVLPAQGNGLNARLLGPLQGIDPRLAGDHRDDLPAAQLSGGLGVNKLLQVGASS